MKMISKRFIAASLTLCSLSAVAHAEESTYFKAGSNQILIETVQMDGVAVSFGLIINNEQSRAALYRIEPVDAISQAWIRMTQDASGLIGTNANEDATFSASIVDQTLTLTPTNFGAAAGCNAEIRATSARGVSWLQFPAGVMRFSGENGSAVVFSTTAMTGSFKVGGRVYNGTFAVQPVIAGIGAIHAQELSPDSPNGRSLSRTIASLVALIHEDGFFKNSNSLKLIKISNGSTCFDNEASLAEK
jgi:hypothetical protein